MNLEAVARLLLRAESVASSRIEGLEVGVGRLARAEAAKEAGDLFTDVTAEAVLGNVEAMQLAVTDRGEARTHRGRHSGAFKPTRPGVILHHSGNRLWSCHQVRHKQICGVRLVANPAKLRRVDTTASARTLDARGIASANPQGCLGVRE